MMKTKGHATEANLQEGSGSEFERKGNDNADYFAGRGTAVAIHWLQNTQQIQECKGW